MASQVPGPLRVTSELSWRVLVVAAAVALAFFALVTLSLVILPVFIALLLTTLLYPPARWLRNQGVPNGLAAGITFAAAVLVVAAVVGVMVPIVISDAEEFDGIQANVENGIDRARDWLVTGPLELSEEEVDRYIDRALDELEANAERFVGGAFSGALLLLQGLAGALLTIVLTFFFLKDGERFWAWFVSLFSPEMQHDAREVGTRAWLVLSGYLRGTAAVAAIDGIFIGLAVWLIGVPLALVIGLLTFVLAFIPIVGAFAAGLVAVLIALGTDGPVAALLVLLAIIAVQQLEGNLVGPLLVGRSVRVHPVATILAVTAGGVLWGVLGAFVAVPIVAVGRSTIGYLNNRPPRDEVPMPEDATDLPSPPPEVARAVDG
ncbi:MAG: AI-2E family transporter [Dehalococcoidia bacterium]|nr:AI-2E family transporter [Dehalococcoidia bacterium]